MKENLSKQAGRTLGGDPESNGTGSGHSGDGEPQPSGLPSITISRSTGARAVTIGRTLATHLNAISRPSTGSAWAVYEKDVLVDRIMGDHRLPPEVRKYVKEDSVGLIGNVLEGIDVGTTDKDLFDCTRDTIHRLGLSGHTIVVGRGSNLINRNLPDAYHVRLSGSEAVRRAHVMQYYELNEAEARHFITHQDHARKRYVKAHFHEDVDDPRLYHLIVNTDHHDDDTVSEIIAGALRSWLRRKRRAPAGE